MSCPQHFHNRKINEVNLFKTASKGDKHFLPPLFPVSDSIGFSLLPSTAQWTWRVFFFSITLSHSHLPCLQVLVPPNQTSRLESCFSLSLYSPQRKSHKSPRQGRQRESLLLLLLLLLLAGRSRMETEERDEESERERLNEMLLEKRHWINSKENIALYHIFPSGLNAGTHIGVMLPNISVYIFLPPSSAHPGPLSCLASASTSQIFPQQTFCDRLGTIVRQSLAGFPSLKGSYNNIWSSNKRSRYCFESKVVFAFQRYSADLIRNVFQNPVPVCRHNNDGMSRCNPCNVSTTAVTKSRICWWPQTLETFNNCLEMLRSPYYSSEVPFCGIVSVQFICRWGFRG